MPPITMLLTTFTCARPPRKWPTMAVANRLSLSVRPPPIIRLPASRNSGIAISGKLSAPVTMRCGSTISGTLPSDSKAAPALTTIANATGMPMANRSRVLPSSR